DAQTRRARKALQILPDQPNPAGVDIERRDIGTFSQKLEEVTGLSTRCRTRIEHPHRWRGIEQRCSELRSGVLDGHETLGEAGKAAYAYREIQTHGSRRPLYQMSVN